MSCGEHVCESGSEPEMVRWRPGKHVHEKSVARIGELCDRFKGVEGSKPDVCSTSEERQLKKMRLGYVHVRGSPAILTMAADAPTAHGPSSHAAGCRGRA